MLRCSGKAPVQLKWGFLQATMSERCQHRAMGNIFWVWGLMGTAGTFSSSVLPPLWNCCWAPAHGMPLISLPHLWLLCHYNLRSEFDEGFKLPSLSKEADGATVSVLWMWRPGLLGWAMFAVSWHEKKLVLCDLNPHWWMSSLFVQDSWIPMKTDFDSNSIVSNSILKSLFKAATQQGKADELHVNNMQHCYFSSHLCVWDVYCCAHSSTWNKT